MALAIWGGVRDVPVQFSAWFVIGLFVAAFVAAVLRAIRRATFANLRGSPILTLWMVTRFIFAPAIVLLTLAWLACWALGLAAAPALLNAVRLAAIYGVTAILITSVVADLAAALKGPANAPPSDS